MENQNNQQEKMQFNFGIDQEKLREQLNESFAKSVRMTLESYDFQKKVTQTISETMIIETLKSSLTQALEELDKSHLVKVMTEELVRTSKKAVGMMLIDSVVRGILSTRNIHSYDSSFNREYNNLLGEFNKGENSNGL